MLSEIEKKEIRKIIEQELKPIREKLDRLLMNTPNTVNQTHALPPIKK